MASHRSYFPDFCSINISDDTSGPVEPDNEYMGIICFNRYVKEPAGCNGASKGNAFNVRKFELAILFCYLPLKLHLPVLFLRMNIGNVEMLAENATPML